MICKECGKEHERQRSKWCSQTCYNKYYYSKNKERINKRRKEWHDKNYVYHPKPKRTEEEKIARRKQYYQDNIEYCRQKCREYHQKHKNDEYYRKRRKENLKRYLKRRKERENASKKM